MHLRPCQYNSMQAQPSGFLRPPTFIPSPWKTASTETATLLPHLCPLGCQGIAISSPLCAISLEYVFKTGSSLGACHKVSCYSTAEHKILLDGEEEEDKLKALKRKVEELGIRCKHFTPGYYQLLLCPKCKGGNLMERSLSFHVHINKSSDFAMWRCFRTECEWSGQAFVDGNPISQRNSIQSEVRSTTANILGLEPLCEKLLSYFAQRMISRETLERNAVMQVSGDQNVIAFCYRTNGSLAGCKYRNVRNKKFWQATGTQKVFYGVDDIKESSEIIIVEGEIDKLSMEEAGFRNCVSVPDGAPPNVSTEPLPSQEKDDGYKYIWNSKECLDKASRIILATDSDLPGQALAEELGRRLRKERCWRVCWPQKEGSGCYKDANEVLVELGPEAVKKAIENAVLYESQSSSQYQISV